MTHTLTRRPCFMIGSVLLTIGLFFSISLARDQKDPINYTSLIIKPTLLLGNGEILITVNSKDRDIISSKMNVDIQLRPSRKNRILNRKHIDIKNSKMPIEVRFPIGRLTPGNYDVISIIMDENGKFLNQNNYPFFIPEKPWWFDSKAGLSNKVLPPWSPLKLLHHSNEKTNLSIECAQRIYEFDPSHLLSNIEAKKKNILYKPIALAARVGGKIVKWEKGSINIKKETPELIQLRQTTSGCGLKLNVSTDIEFDGAIKIDLTIEPQYIVQLERLTLNIPLKTEFAQYLYIYPKETWGKRLTTSFFPSIEMAGPFIPYLWTGDSELGLAWYSESDEGWINDDPANVIKLSKIDGQALIQIQLIDKAIKLGGNENRKIIKYKFGFQATPVKTYLSDVWDYRISHITQNAYGNVRLKIPDKTLDQLAHEGVRTIVFHEHWTDIESYYETSYEDDLKILIKRCHDRGMQLLLYFGFLISDIAPEWPFLGNECILGMTAEGYTPWNYPPQPIQNAYRVCYKSIWQNCIAAGIDRAMSRFDCDGVYLDGTQFVWGCDNIRHGCGYVRPDGTLSVTYPIWEVRQLMKRIYTIVKTHKPNGQVNVHSSSCNVIPTLSWATSYWDGEQFNYVKQNTAVTDVISLEMFRLEFMGKPLGIPAEFLLSGAFNFKEALAITLLHDVPIRTIGINDDLGLMSSLWRLRDQFETSNAEWLPYFLNADYVRVGPEGCFVSFFRHPRNGVLVFLANLSKQETTANVRFAFDQLGLSGNIKAKDGLSEDSIVIHDDTIQISLPKLGWKTIWIRN